MGVRSGAGGGGGGSPSTVTLTGASSLTQTVNATSADGFLLANTTAAAAGAQQWSPRLHWTGQGWKTTATAASQSVDWIAEVQPVQGTTAPTSNWVLSSSINGAAYTNQLQITSGGSLRLSNTSWVNVAASAAFFKFGTTDGGVDGSVYASRWRDDANGLAVGANGIVGMFMQTAGHIAWTNDGTWYGTADTFLKRAAAATLQLGAANAAAPVAQTLQAQGSRAATDTDTGGASLTVRAGAGTGTGTTSKLTLQTPVAVASGTGAQTMTDTIVMQNGLVTSYNQGTTFPTSPGTYQRFFRTDLGLECYYDGTRWLTVQEYPMPTFTSSGSHNYSVSATDAFYVDAPIDQTQGGSYVTRVVANSYVGTTNNGSNYWTVQLYSADSADATATNIGSAFTTASDAVNRRALHAYTVGAAVGGSQINYWVSVTKTGSAGSISMAVVIYYRLIVT